MKNLTYSVLVYFLLSNTILANVVEKFYENGNLKHYYNPDALDGEPTSQEFFEDGKVKREQIRMPQKIEGVGFHIHRNFRPDGTLEEEYIRGRAGDAVRKTYYPSGKLHIHEILDNYRLAYRYTYNPDGSLELSEDFFSPSEQLAAIFYTTTGIVLILLVLKLRIEIKRRQNQAGDDNSE